MQKGITMKKKILLILLIFSFALNCTNAFSQIKDKSFLPLKQINEETTTIIGQKDEVLIAQYSQYTKKNDETLKDDDEDFEDYYDKESIYIADPLYYFNYLIFSLNDFLYFAAIEPITTGYKAIAPDPVRKGIKNFFHNLLFPTRFASNILQCKFKNATIEVGNFVVNSTIGILGFLNPAGNLLNLNTNDEDLGQTLGHYSVGHGFYFVLPLIGPSSLRDAIGNIGDYFLSPVNYIEKTEIAIGTKALDTINTTSFYLGDYEALKKASLDPYVAMRDIYLQRRDKAIKK